MMGKSHAEQAICGAAVIGSALVAANAPLAGQIGVLAVAGLLMVSGGTFPDIDAEGSHATKSFGHISHMLHSLTHLLTQALYNATLGHRDRRKKGSHRLLTHTALGNVFAGLALIALCYAHPVVAAIAVGFLIGMTVAVWRKRWKWIGWLGGAALAYGTYDPRWLWVWGLAFTLGNMIHCFGDSCTKSGTPWFWPMMRDGKRWGASHALPEWALIKTGTANERILRWLTYGLTLAAIGAIFFVGSFI